MLPEFVQRTTVTGPSADGPNEFVVARAIPPRDPDDDDDNNDHDEEEDEAEEDREPAVIREPDKDEY